MSKGCRWVEHFGLLDVDMHDWLYIVAKHVSSTALDTPTFAPTRARRGRNLPMMVWPIVQARCHLIGATFNATGLDPMR